MESYLNLAHQRLLSILKNYPQKDRPLYLKHPQRQKLEQDLQRCQEALSLLQPHKAPSSLGVDSLDEFPLLDPHLFEENSSKNLSDSEEFLVTLHSQLPVTPELPPHSTSSELLKILLINQKLNQEYDQKKLMNFILDRMIELAQAERGFFVLTVKEKPVIKVARNMDQAEIQKPEMKLSSTIFYEMFHKKKEILIDNALEESDYKGNKSVVSQGVRSVLCVPLTSKRDATQ